jgi:hypothetical protein
VSSRIVAFLIGLALLGFGSRVEAVPLANSVAEFSGVQGQDNWYYGFYNQGAAGGLPHGYTSTGFTEFDTFSAGLWRASVAQVGLNNNIFLNVNPLGGHPNGLDLGQNALIWAIRRYQSEVSGLVDIAFDLRKLNVTNPLGGGITGRIFIDGVEVWTQFIANFDGTGVQGVLTQNVLLGSFIDFAIDPTSNNPPLGQSAFSARADGSHFSATIATSTISTIPEPSSLALYGAGSLVLLGWGFSTRIQQRKLSKFGG